MRTLGVDERTEWTRYHRMLNDARWSGVDCSRTLLRLLVDAFVPTGEPLVFAIDETIERR